MSDPIKVAMDVTPLFGNQTGIGNVTRAMVSGLAQRPEIDVSGVLVSFRGRSELASVLPEGVTPKPVVTPARLSHWLWKRTDWPCLSGYDLVHGTNYIVPPSRKSTELITVHDMTAWRYPELLDSHTHSIPKLVERAVGRGAHIQTVSKYVANEVPEYVDINPERVHTVANGYSQEAAGDINEGLRLAGGNYILALGTIEPRKDYPTLVAAMNEVWKVYPELRLVVAGAEGWGVEKFNEAVARYKAENNILRLGYVNDQQRADLLAGAELLVYPSLYEGFGLPLLEAMGAETPVVATQVGAIPEVVGDAAVLVPPKADDALAGAVLDVLEKQNVQDYLVEAGKLRIKEYTWESAIDSMAELYQKIA